MLVFRLHLAHAALPPHLLGHFMTTDGRVFPYRIITGAAISSYLTDNKYENRWVMKDCLFYQNKNRVSYALTWPNPIWYCNPKTEPEKVKLWKKNPRTISRLIGIYCGNHTGQKFVNNKKKDR